MVKNLTFRTILCRLAAEYFMQKGVELGFDLRLTSTWTEVTRGCWMASFSAWHVNCDPRSPRLSDIRTSLRPVPVPSSSSNELTLPVKREYPAHAKKVSKLTRGHQLCCVLTGDNVGTIEPGDTRNGFTTGGLTDQTQFVTFIERANDRAARNVSPIRCWHCQVLGLGCKYNTDAVLQVRNLSKAERGRPKADRAKRL